MVPLNETQPVGSRAQLSPAVRRFRLWESTGERGNELALAGALREYGFDLRTRASRSSSSCHSSSTRAA
ncbi:MAG: hypothetical protein ACOZQL_25425 [Myxococcota bacterium]